MRASAPMARCRILAIPVLSDVQALQRMQVPLVSCQLMNCQPIARLLSRLLVGPTAICGGRASHDRTWVANAPEPALQAMHYRRAQFLLGHMKVLQPFITPQAAARIRCGQAQVVSYGC